MYHEGELDMQRRAGVTELASRVGRIISADIPAPIAAFLAARSFVIVTTIDADGAPRASLLGGTPGFAHALDPHTISLSPAFGHVELARDDFGLLAIDFPNKRRIRLNGRAVQEGDVIRVTAAEVYSNCPQYIHTNPLAPARDTWQEWVEGADTFFIGSVHPTRGADTSHRGGPRGFARVEGETIVWPDYSGNNMFNTLGNLTVEPRSALLFVDFGTGATLELLGRASVEGDTEREVRFVVYEVKPTAAGGSASTRAPSFSSEPPTPV
jgi:predicted pyridoxine 5'-phosphate oxidase superfamily flavin-nucleotide-binding protein